MSRQDLCMQQTGLAETDWPAQDVGGWGLGRMSKLGQIPLKLGCRAGHHNSEAVEGLLKWVTSHTNLMGHRKCGGIGESECEGICGGQLGKMLKHMSATLLAGGEMRPPRAVMSGQQAGNSSQSTCLCVGACSGSQRSQAGLRLPVTAVWVTPIPWPPQCPPRPQRTRFPRRS